MDDSTLTAFVNGSGFPLQLALVDLIDRTTLEHGWRVLCTEHAWKHAYGDSSGFIDFVVQDHAEISTLIVECKRVLDSSWVFLVPDSQFKSRRHVKTWATQYLSSNQRRFGWADIAIDPPSYQSQFCVVPGQDAKSKPMLERIASELLLATEALAAEEQAIFAKHDDARRLYFNVIVTTAELKVCSFEASTISVTDGKLQGAAFEEVPFIRFRKQLSTEQIPGKGSLADLAKARENTVFVVNSRSVIDFLKAWRVDEASFRLLVR